MKELLMPEEVSGVLPVTKGERYDHRRWPEEVIRAFASAQVITEKVSQRQAADRARPASGKLTRFLRHG